MTCNSCKQPIQKGWIACPFCGTAADIPPACESCGREVDAGWLACPYCSTRLRPSGPPSVSPAPSASPSSPFLTGVAPPGSSSGSAASPFSSSQGASPPSASPAGAVRAPVLEAGATLAKYRIEEVLGHGASGTVYRAWDPDLGEMVALKAMGTFGDPEALRSALAEEFKVQRKIKAKEHLLESYPPTQVEALGLRWVLLPMELAEGTLRGWLEEKGGDPEHLSEGLELLRQAAAGLKGLHGAGLVHRDVKPENVLLVVEGEGKKRKWVAKVGDFGLAGSLEKLAAERPELVGDGVGTPAYMAPEQVLAAHWKDVGSAADVYAIGTILFELLDGARPFSGSAEALRAKKRDTSLKPRRPTGPDHLTELALGMLVHEAGMRPGLDKIVNELVEVAPEERALWEKASKADTEDSYAKYLKAYSKGAWSGEAEERRAELEKERAAQEEEDRKERAKAVAARRKADAERKAEAELARERAEAEARANAEATTALESILRGMVGIPTGEFMMGDALWEPCHLVRITREFVLQTTPVTQGQWQAVMGSNPSRFKGDASRPVEKVSWEDAQAFIGKLNGVSIGGFRLPTEAEWEYACRAGTPEHYIKKEVLDEMCWFKDNSGGETHPVGLKQPNAWGLYDMLGNVEEWCQDWYDDEYYARSPEVDPQGPTSGEYRVLRGGSWNRAMGADWTSRGSNLPSHRSPSVGFRLARTL